MVVSPNDCERSAKNVDRKNPKDYKAPDKQDLTRLCIKQEQTFPFLIHDYYIFLHKYLMHLNKGFVSVKAPFASQLVNDHESYCLAPKLPVSQTFPDSFLLFNFLLTFVLNHETIAKLAHQILNEEQTTRQEFCQDSFEIDFNSHYFTILNQSLSHSCRRSFAFSSQKPLGSSQCVSLSPSVVVRWAVCADESST